MQVRAGAQTARTYQKPQLDRGQAAGLDGFPGVFRNPRFEVFDRPVQEFTHIDAVPVARPRIDAPDVSLRAELWPVKLQVTRRNRNRNRRHLEKVGKGARYNRAHTRQRESSKEYSSGHHREIEC